MSQILKTRLAPFRHRDYRNFFLAQTLSMVGTWSHDLARSWIVVEATGSSGALGNLNTAVAVPCLFLILQGGVLVDRSDVRRLIQWTKSLLGIAGLALAALTEFTHLALWQLTLFALAEGIITAFDAPAFQALIVRMVPRQEFQQALALNSTNFHTSRMLGPVVAAWLMMWHGPSLVFLFDGVTYFAVAFVLSRVTMLKLTHATAPKVSLPPGPAVLEGIRYIYLNLGLRYRLAQLFLALGCAQPMLAVIFRVYVQKKFGLNAHQFGEAFSFPALGSMCGALSFAVIKPKSPIRALWLGVPLVFLMLLALPWMPNLGLTVAIMSLAGFGLYLTFASLTVSMQLEVDEAFRGRLSSVIGLGFSCLGPLMSSPWGHLADSFGPPLAMNVSAAVFGLASAWLALRYRVAAGRSPRLTDSFHPPVPGEPPRSNLAKEERSATAIGP